MDEGRVGRLLSVLLKMLIWAQRDYRAALKSYESPLQLDPDFTMAHAALAGAYLSHGCFEPQKGREHYRFGVVSSRAAKKLSAARCVL